MRIFVVADYVSAVALRDALNARNPCASGWELLSEPRVVIEDLTLGLDRSVPMSQGRWMVVCRDDI
ncbi:MAG TPA: hypothetical protein VGE57_00255 [Solimonas sp.]